MVFCSVESVVSLIIDRIEIFEDKQSNGRRVKRIDFKIPIYVGDKEMTV